MEQQAAGAGDLAAAGAGAGDLAAAGAGAPGADRTGGRHQGLCHACGALAAKVPIAGILSSCAPAWSLPQALRLADLCRLLPLLWAAPLQGSGGFCMLVYILLSASQDLVYLLPPAFLQCFPTTGQGACTLSMRLYTLTQRRCTEAPQPAPWLKCMQNKGV